jgi:hypothetical protein
MTYRNSLLERSRNFALENDEPVVLDYLQLRNRQCFDAWQQRRAEYALNAAIRAARAKGETERPVA